MSEFVKLLKTILKIIGVFILMIACAIAAYYFWNRYQEEKITMISLECIWEETSEGIINAKRWYLIKKQRNSLVPYGIYRGAHLKSSPTKEKIFLQSKLEFTNSDYYIFKLISFDRLHKINRKNLKISFKKDNIWTEGQCIEITEKEFYQNIEDKIKQKNSGVIF